jgi:hypothetical protein
VSWTLWSTADNYWSKNLIRKDKVGFEPTVFLKNTIVFKTNALNRSTTYPLFFNSFTKKDLDCIVFVNLRIDLTF